jgi:16S rRNA (cytidine1402-2'-O)-methyltransferase
LGTLYIVSTPIGNLEDITLRALRILREVQLIAAEDTRTSRVLLNHYTITTPLISYHEHNKLTRLEAIFDALAAGDVALISDAGTPGISDPGYELICAALERDIRVEPLPGPNAIIPALVGSGLPVDSFIYVGFLPKKKQARQALLTELAGEQRTLVAYESPNRLLDSLETIITVLGAERPVCVARELSKKFEEFTRGSAGEVLDYYRANPPRGEITLVIGGAALNDDSPWDEERVRDALDAQLRVGESLSAAAKAVAAKSGWKRRDVYALGTEDTPVD